MGKVNVKNLSKEEIRELTNDVSRGYSQFYVVLDLLTEGETAPINEYMKAQSYSSNYQRSYANAIDRLQARIKNPIEHKLGPLGGTWASRYQIGGLA